MAFFKNFQQNLPSVSSLVDTISSAVEDLTTAVGEVSCALTDSVTEQVTSMINGLRPEEESRAAEEAVDTSKSKDAMLLDVSKNTACQETQSSVEHRAKPRRCGNSPASQKQEPGKHEERLLKHINDRQQTLSEHQEISNAGDSSLKSHMSNGGISVNKQSPRAKSTCQELESIGRCKTVGLEISSNGKNDGKEARCQEMKGNQNTTNEINILYEQKKYIATDNHKTESQPVLVGGEQEKMGHFSKNKNLDLGDSDHLKKTEKQIKSKGFKGSECSGNECSPKSKKNRIQKSIVKEDTYPASSANFKEKFPGKIKGQMNPRTYYKVRGDNQTNKNEASSTKKGTAKSKVEKYSKIIPEKGEVL